MYGEALKIRNCLSDASPIIAELERTNHPFAIRAVANFEEIRTNGNILVNVIKNVEEARDVPLAHRMPAQYISSFRLVGRPIL